MEQLTWSSAENVSMSGAKLIQNLISATGLPLNDDTQAGMLSELQRLAKTSGKNTDNMTLDDLRDVLAEYLQEVLLSAQEEFSSDP
jgi:hypothetical protein